MPPDAAVSRRAVLSGAVAAVAGLALAACRRTPEAAPQAAGDSIADGAVRQVSPQGEGGAAGPRRFASVAMIGDSITVGSTPAIQAALAAEGIDEVTVDAQNSRRIQVGGGAGEPRSGMQALTTLLDDGIDPDAWVVALGTNDIGAYREEEYEEVVRGLLDVIPGGVPLVWIDVYRPPYLDISADFNALVRRLAAARGNAVVTSWYAVCVGDREVLQADDVHPNEAGREEFAALVVEGLEQLSGRS